MSSISPIGNLIILIGAVQGIFLSAMVWSQKSGSKTANCFLAVFLFIFSMQMIYFILWNSRWILQVPHLSMTLAPLNFALAPLFYFYTLYLTQKNFRFERRDAFHFMFVIVGYIYFLSFYLESAAEKIHFNQQSYERIPDLWSTFTFVCIVQMGLYTALTLLVLLRHIRTVKKYYSSIEKIDLGWIRTIMLMLAACFFSCILLSVTGFQWTNYYSNIIFSFAIYTMGYCAMRQQSFFNDFSEEEISGASGPSILKAEETGEIQKKYEKQELTAEMATGYLDQLEQQMRNQKLFLNPGITLQHLADTLGISPHHLSQILNQYKEQNFFDYINKLRVEEFKRKIFNQEKKLFSISAIAFECGFNSKAAFNSTFKKFTGLTPSAYRNRLTPDNADLRKGGKLE